MSTSVPLSKTQAANLAGSTVLTVSCRSGRILSIPAHHPVFVPLGDYREGDTVDPLTVAFQQDRAFLFLMPGLKLIVDSKVEIIATVR